MRAPWLVVILAEILEPLLLLGETVCYRNDTDLSVTGQRSREILPRRRRELTFPKGSVFVVSQIVGCSRDGRVIFCNISDLYIRQIVQYIDLKQRKLQSRDISLLTLINLILFLFFLFYFNSIKIIPLKIY